MKHSYRISGIDRRGGHKRSEVIWAWSAGSATAEANRRGLMFDDVEQLPTVPCVYRIVFAVLKTLTLFLALIVLVRGVQVSTSAIHEILIMATVCALLILARVFQAEEKSRRTP